MIRSSYNFLKIQSYSIGLKPRWLRISRLLDSNAVNGSNNRSRMREISCFDRNPKHVKFAIGLNRMLSQHGGCTVRKKEYSKEYSFSLGQSMEDKCPFSV